MTATREPKKSETIEVRMSFDAKRAFLERCRQDRCTASDAIRGFIDDRTRAGSRPVSARPIRWRMAAMLGFGMVLGVSAAVPSLARTAQTDRAAFDRIDRNHDAVLSYQEFRAR